MVGGNLKISVMGFRELPMAHRKGKAKRIPAPITTA
jgi:hypothetical protein